MQAEVLSSEGRRVAIWLRVSDTGQHTENQLPDLEAFAARLGATVVKIYEIQASGWKGQHQKALSLLYADARQSRFDVVLVWALDRLSRQGVAALLEIVNRLAQHRVRVFSFQEGWTQVEGPLQELLFSVVAWVARMESERRSERTLAGLSRVRSEGKRLGRPPGAKDQRQRKKSGYFRRWDVEHEIDVPANGK